MVLLVYFCTFILPVPVLDSFLLLSTVGATLLSRPEIDSSVNYAKQLRSALL